MSVKILIVFAVLYTAVDCMPFLGDLVNTATGGSKKSSLLGGLGVQTVQQATGLQQVISNTGPDEVAEADNLIQKAAMSAMSIPKVTGTGNPLKKLLKIKDKKRRDRKRRTTTTTTEAEEEEEEEEEETEASEDDE